MMAVAILSSAASVFAQGNTSKLSPYLMQVMQEQATTHRVAAATQVTVLAKLADGADEQALAAQYGFEVLNRIGRVLIIRMALSDIPAMADNKDVVRIEAERAPRPMMDLVPQQIQADLVHSGISNGLDANYNGKGVVVGIVDAGFDYIHPFFRDSEGQTRVVWAADYMKNKKYTTRADITNAMHSSDAATMYHGTHVAGIAAGSKAQDSDWNPETSKTYQGVAPGADIAMAAVNSEIKTDGSGLQFDNSLQAFTDIFNYAEEQQKPCVINFSMGDAMSFSNNRELASEAIATLLSKPGRALVVSSGNSGSSFRLAHKTANMSEGGSVSARRTAYTVAIAANSLPRGRNWLQRPPSSAARPSRSIAEAWWTAITLFILRQAIPPSPPANVCSSRYKVRARLGYTATRSVRPWSPSTA